MNIDWACWTSNDNNHLNLKQFDDAKPHIFYDNMESKWHVVAKKQHKTPYFVKSWGYFFPDVNVIVGWNLCEHCRQLCPEKLWSNKIDHSLKEKYSSLYQFKELKQNCTNLKNPTYLALCDQFSSQHQS